MAPGRPSYHVNLQQGFGGGEVYAAQFAGAVARLGVPAKLFVHRLAKGWDRLALDGVTKVGVEGEEALQRALLGVPPGWVVFHTVPPPAMISALKGHGHFTSAFLHMPLRDRDPSRFRPLDMLFAVSRYVMDTAREARLVPLYAEPLYGAVSLTRGAATRGIVAASPYDWDGRKLRDRALGALERVAGPFTPRAPFARRPGMTLGIVSRLTPIKQFPALFAAIAPVLVRHADVNVEIFGSGGYASVRDLRAALSPIAGRVRFWGAQRDVAAAYREIDALLTGLPEKEALGLNVLEAQACGTAVFAPDAPPFDETVLHEVTGLRYADPRSDGGRAFEGALQRLRDGWKPDLSKASAHMETFTAAAFEARVGRVVRALVPSA